MDYEAMDYEAHKAVMLINEQGIMLGLAERLLELINRAKSDRDTIEHELNDETLSSRTKRYRSLQNKKFYFIGHLQALEQAFKMLTGHRSSDYLAFYELTN
tara:strand:- start:7994 stop:8296 length:303 start_codon:yes stop_codon:yes gene_type:complete